MGYHFLKDVILSPPFGVAGLETCYRTHEVSGINVSSTLSTSWSYLIFFKYLKQVSTIKIFSIYGIEND